MANQTAGCLKDAAAGDFSPGRLAGAWGRLQPAERTIFAILVIALLARFAARPWAPLWLDEAATGAIISQPNFAAFWKEVYWEVSSPLYFLFMRGWQSIFGVSDLALRAPSILFSVAAPLAILSFRISGLSKLDKLSWAALLALWIPGIGYAQDARCYALVFFLSALQTASFIRLIDKSSFGNCALWVLFAALTIAAHYDAAILALAQGLAFVAKRPRDAIRYLPAGLIMVPTLALALWQWPEMTRFMHPDTTWYKPFTTLRAFVGGLYILGGPLWIFGLPPLLITAAIAGRRQAAIPKIPDGALWAGMTSVIAASALIALGMDRPILTLRYLAPFAPGALLLLIIVIRVLAKGAADSFIQLLVTAAAAILVFWIGAGAYHVDSVAETLNYEVASSRVMQSGARHVVFAWDNPNARAMHTEQIREFGAFFFKRAGYPMDVIPVQIGENQNPNVLLLNAARPTRAAIVWLYDNSINHTAAKDFPPDISAVDARWNCENSKSGNFGVVVCLAGETDSGKGARP